MAAFLIKKLFSELSTILYQNFENVMNYFIFHHPKTSAFILIISYIFCRMYSPL